MRSRGVVGKRIVRIDQERVYNENGRNWFYALSRIVLEDGTTLYPIEHELPGDLATELCAHRPERKRRTEER